MIRASCFEELGGFNADYFGSGDWEMWYRIAEKHQVGFIEEPMTMYRVHGANASHKLDRIWRDDERLRTWIAARIASYKGRFSDEDLSQAEAHNWACLGTVRTLNGNPAAGREAYRKSLQIQPSRWQSRARLIATYLPKSVFRRLL